MKAYQLPLGINIDEKNPHASTCIRCDSCDGYPCLVHAKSDAEVCCVTPALQNSNVEILTGAYVKSLEANSKGEISIVHVEKNGEPLQIKGKVVIVSCGAINSAALLLRSKSDQYPNGLANSSGLLGKNYMCHNNMVVVAVSTEPNTTQF